MQSPISNRHVTLAAFDKQIATSNDLEGVSPAASALRKW